MRHFRFLTAALTALAACTVAGPMAESGPKDALAYRLHYQLTLDPLQQRAEAAITLRQAEHLLREARFSLADSRWTDFRGDGTVRYEGDTLVWLPPERGGTLSWDVDLEHLREGGYDARLTPTWALFRGEDAFPAAATRTLAGAHSVSSLSVQVPNGWSVVTPYASEDGRFRVVNPERRFDRPTGWMVAGDLGVRRDEIAGVKVTVAGPVGQGVRRLDVLALLNWTLPRLIGLIPDFPDRLTIVSAGDPMWRGALSGPDSLYVHADRPLISENATSTIVHELMHIGLGREPARGSDWIVEGFAEYYSLELLRRSGTITRERQRDTLAELADWGSDVTNLEKRYSTGATTARAVIILRDLDREIRSKTTREHSLDDVLGRLARNDGKLDLAELEKAVKEILGGASETLESDAFTALLRGQSDRK